MEKEHDPIHTSSLEHGFAIGPPRQGRIPRELAEHYLSARVVGESINTRHLLNWLTARLHYLPTYGWNEHLIRDITRLAPREQQELLRTLPEQLLSQDDVSRWNTLFSQHQVLTQQLIQLWIGRRLIPDSTAEPGK